MTKIIEADLRQSEIVTRLKLADTTYYNTGKINMTDAEYDVLKDQLRKLNPEHPYLTAIGAPVPGGWVKTKLLGHMGSQLKVQTLEEARAWFEKYNTPVVGSLKLDGSSVELFYEDGKLVRAVTRGDGEYGQDVTRNALHWQGVPKEINVPTGSRVTFRGEVVLRKSIWKEHFSDTANPRNAGNGTILRLDGRGNQHMHFVVFDTSLRRWWNPQTNDFKPVLTVADKMDVIIALGFNPVTFYVLPEFKDVAWYYGNVVALRDSYDITIDGVVLAINDLRMQEALGYAEGGSKPRGQVAWKFEAAKAITRVVDIELKVGSTGALAPTCVLEPVEVAGVVITRATLNNFEFIKELNLNIGDMVEVQRANDVIPQIVRVTEKKSAGGYEAPAKCPECHGKLTQTDGGRVIKCVNPTCGGKQRSRIMSWIRKTGIENIGDALLDALMDQSEGIPLVLDLIDLYLLTPAELENLQVGSGGRLGASMAVKVVDSIHEKKVMSIHILMGSLSIPFLGRRMAQKIGLQTIEEWLSISEAELATKEGMGSNKAREIRKGIIAASPLILALKAIVQIKTPEPKSTIMADKPTLTGKVFVFTGVRPTPDETARMQHLGGEMKDSVSKSTTSLVQKDASKESTKSKKAKELGMEVISYDDFKQLIA